MEELILKSIYTSYPSLINRGFTLVQVEALSNYSTRIQCILMNKKKCHTFILDKRNFRILSMDSIKVSPSISITTSINKEKLKAYNHAYYMKVTKEKRKATKSLNKEVKKTTICKLCGKEFKQKVNGRLKICRSCKHILNHKPTLTRVCKHCKKKFETTDTRKHYCSTTCRNSHNNQLSYYRRIK